jgi:hypothetical protein
MLQMSKDQRVAREAKSGNMPLRVARELQSFLGETSGEGVKW